MATNMLVSSGMINITENGLRLVEVKIENLPNYKEQFMKLMKKVVYQFIIKLVLEMELNQNYYLWVKKVRMKN